MAVAKKKEVSEIQQALEVLKRKAEQTDKDTMEIIQRSDRVASRLKKASNTVSRRFRLAR